MTKTIDAAPALRVRAIALAVSGCLLFLPFVAGHAANGAPTESAVSTDSKAFGRAVKRDANRVAAACREGAHRVAVASKAVAHDIATTAKRGAAQTRAAFRGTQGEKAGG